MEMIEVTCSSCGKLDVLLKKPDPEGYYCADCVNYWTKDPLTDKEKQTLSEPLHIAQIRKIYREKNAAGAQCPVFKKRMLMDLFSASIIIKAYDALNNENKEKAAKLSITNLQRVALKVAK